eukprot:1126115-Pelagomonas_calceolata.AAC.4
MIPGPAADGVLGASTQQPRQTHRLAPPRTTRSTYMPPLLAPSTDQSRSRSSPTRQQQHLQLRHHIHIAGGGFVAVSRGMTLT